MIGFRPVEAPAQLRVNTGLLELLAKHAAAPDAAQQPHVLHRGLASAIAAAKLPQRLGAGGDVAPDQRQRRPTHPAPPAARPQPTAAGAGAGAGRPRSTSPQARLAAAGVRRNTAQPDPLLKVPPLPASSALRPPCLRPFFPRAAGRLAGTKALRLPANKPRLPLPLPRRAMSCT